MGLLFPINEYWWLYLAFVGGVGILLALDLGVFHRHAHAVRFKEAALWSAIWVTLALLFNLGLYHYSLWRFRTDPALLALPGFDPEQEAGRVAMEFLTGYVVEKTLAVDNIFVFVLVFSSFGIPPIYQHRVLYFGILGALFFRAIFIALGAKLMSYAWIELVFGAFLVLTGLRMFFTKKEEEIAPSKSRVLRLIQRLLPVQSELEGQKFVVRREGRIYATPLLTALLFLEMSDILFAMDSVPAIFALTREPLIVFTSNILAILGLRSMYFLLAGVIDRFIYLKSGVALVLVFVGIKMLWPEKDGAGHFPISLSLGVIAILVFGSILLSLIATRRRGRKDSRDP